MPNWTRNTLAVVGSKKDIKAFKDKYLKGGFSFRKVIPEPKNRLEVPEKYVVDDSHTWHDGKKDHQLNWMDIHYDWYGWRVDNWGTKWDVNSSEVESNNDDYSVELDFQTAWSPPIKVIEKMISDFPNLKIRIQYSDEFFDWAGYFDSKEGLKEVEAPEAEHFDEHYDIDEWLEKQINKQKQEEKSKKKSSVVSTSSQKIR